MQVGLHQLLDEIHVSEQLETRRLEDVENGDDVLVAKVAEKFDLAEGAQTKHGMVKGRDTLDRDLSLGRVVDGRAGPASMWGASLTRKCTDQTMPYAPSPITSSTRYAPSTVKFSSRWSMDMSTLSVWMPNVAASDFGIEMRSRRVSIAVIVIVCDRRRSWP